MAGSNKNSSRSSGLVGSKGPSISAEVNLIQALNGGKHARVFNTATMGSTHVAVPSPGYDAAITALSEAGFADRVNTEIANLNASFPGSHWNVVTQPVTV